VKGVVFNSRSEVLLLKNPRDEWELPGGRLDEGEAPRECLAREIGEECGVQAVPGKALSPHVFEVIPGKHVLLVPFLCAVVGGQVNLSSEHSEAGFFGKEALGGIRLPREYVLIIDEARKAR
jgi:8-oxo-dGTP pyrophosphatase MutT (NUDIX family)